MSTADLAGRRVLLLQGPIGPYFRRLARQLRAQGADAVIKVNFNGGDKAFYPGGIDYRGPMESIADFVEALASREQIDLVMFAGDCRPVHAGIASLCARQGVELRVFEEGYFRPAYITCELGGVNGYSAIPNDPEFYRNLPEQKPVMETMPARGTYWAMVGWTILYYAACVIGWPIFPRYRHHRSLHPVMESLAWVRGSLRKWRYRLSEAAVMPLLTDSLSGRYFIVPLQVHNDAQVQVHSRYRDVLDFVREVLRSFADHAPRDAYLVFKHHPMDRAYRDYGRQIRSLAKTLGVAGRVLYIHDQHLPTVLDHARGAVVINSTVGLAAIHQGVPTKVMGTAFYDFEGLTFQGGLDEFWAEPSNHTPDRGLYITFRRWVIRHTQINDSFYRPISHGAAVNNESHFAPRRVHERSGTASQEIQKA